MTLVQEMQNEHSIVDPKSAPITVGTIAWYLLGSKEAIAKLAADQRTVGLGLLFVISAGFAREYDGEDLLAEPWHLGLPLVASLATSFVLFGLLCVTGLCRNASVKQFFKSYHVFLGLYWMTAPLAWLYAIPVERFMSEGGSVSANLQLLAIVSTWRVILIIRVISVIFDARVFYVIPLVMLFADSIALSLVSFLPTMNVSLMAIMGGVRLTAAQAAIFEATMLVTLLGWLSLPLWILGSLGAIFASKADWAGKSLEPRTNSIGLSVWVTGFVSIAIWILVLPVTQPEQRLRHVAEALLRTGQLTEAIQLMVAHRQDQFPPHWDPPPRFPYRDLGPSTIKLAEAVVGLPDEWVRRIFIDKFHQALGGRRIYSDEMHRMSNADRMRVMKVLGQLADRDEIFHGVEDDPHHIESLKYLATSSAQEIKQDGGEPVTDEVRELAKKLVNDFESKVQKSKADDKSG